MYVDDTCTTMQLDQKIALNSFLQLKLDTVHQNENKIADIFRLSAYC